MTLGNGRVFTQAIIYLRCSSEDQAASGLGLDAQEGECRRYAASSGLEIIAVHSDAAVSSGVPMDKRPALAAALGALAPGVVILVARRDRLARNYVEAAVIDSLAERAGGKVVSAAGEGTEADSGDPAAFLQKVIVDAFAQYERMIIRLRVRNALAVKRARGERLGGTPYGWTTVAQQPVGGKHIPGIVSVNEDQQRAIRLARELRAQGFTIRAIAERLNQEGHTAKRGGRWHPGNAARLLQTRYIEHLDSRFTAPGSAVGGKCSHPEL